MNERDGEAMNQARMRALEEIAVNYISVTFAEAKFPLIDSEAKILLEEMIEERAPGCSHRTY